MTIISTPSTAASSLPSTSRHTLDNDPSHANPLREKRRQLQQIQARLSQIERTKGQLQHLLITPRHRQRKPSSSEKSSWSMQSDVSRSSLASEIQDGQLLVPLSGAAFVPATIKGSLADNESDQTVVYIRQDERSTTAQVETLFLHEDAESPPPGYEEMTVPQAMALVTQLGEDVEKRLISLRDEVIDLARETLVEHLSGELESMSAAPVNEQGQAINEEGLPFVDPIEQLTEEKEKNGIPSLSNFERKVMSREDRKNYVDSVLDELEAEEEQIPPSQLTDEESPRATARQDTRPSIHRRVSSADRPPPTKSVLKHTGPIPPPLPRFGSSGVRRGFLNLNPSSPAAERSSDPIQSYNFNQTPQATVLTRSNSTTAESVASDDSSKEERMSRSAELPLNLQQRKKKKKTVRIQSPVREIESTPSNEQYKNKDKDRKDVEEEAKSILELLGLEAIKDHPQTSGLYEAIKDGEKMRQLAEKAESARHSAIKVSEGKSVKPAVGQIVSERNVSRYDSTRNDTSGFKRGFLNGKLPNKVPSAPQRSLGMSALDRATQSDKVLEEEREKQGLKPAVPHARPSKAFAAKLEAKRRGEAIVDEDNEGNEQDNSDFSRKSRVHFGQGDDGEVQVEVGTAASTASGILREDPQASHRNDSERDEDDGSMDAIGMQIREEDLDEDTVEALGYFSDEDYDPDVGWDEEDLEISRPTFSADVESISNEELRKEYERMKASLNQQQFPGNANTHNENDEGTFAEGADLSMQDDNDDTPEHKVSRFKQDLAKRKLQGQIVKSNELGTNLHQATNLGPSMLIPSIANVRYPKLGQTMMEGQEIELDGDSDEENLEEMMRQRLKQRQNGEGRRITNPTSEQILPPEIMSSQQSDLKKDSSVKKPSLFKSRMNLK